MSNPASPKILPFVQKEPQPEILNGLIEMIERNDPDELNFIIARLEQAIENEQKELERLCRIEDTKQENHT